MNYSRRKTSTVHIGGVKLGSDYPIRLQSMTSTSTMDTEGSVAQCKRICDAGADIVRLTAQGVREADNIGEIRSILRNAGYSTPLVADIHFNPKAAFAAAKVTDKVRINPGNFVDVARTFKKLSFTQEEYAQEIQKISELVLSTVGALADEAENMMNFMNEETIAGYSQLIQTGTQYSEDAGSFYNVMQESLQQARRLGEEIGRIKESMTQIVNASDESIRNIEDVTSNVSELTEDLEANKNQAGNNMQAVENLEAEVGKFII